MKHNTTILFGIMAISISSWNVNAQEGLTPTDKIRSVSKDSSFLWESGNCRWITKHYANLPGDILKTIENGQIGLQMPSENRNDSQTGIDEYQMLLKYLSRCLSPKMTKLCDLHFNKNGWRLDEYADISQSIPSNEEAKYTNIKFPNQGITTTIQIGDVCWTRTPRDSQFNRRQGVAVGSGITAPIAFGNVLQMFFIENIFLPVNGRSISVIERRRNEFEISGKLNQGTTVMQIRAVEGVLFMLDQKTRVNDILWKVGGELGRLEVTGCSRDKRAFIPKYTVDVSKRGESSNVDIMLYEFEVFDIKEIRDQDIIRGLE